MDGGGGVCAVAVAASIITGPYSFHHRYSMPWVATAAMDGLLHIWDIQTMKIRTTCRHEVCEVR